MPFIPKYTLCQELGCKNPKSRLNRFCLEHGGRNEQPYNPKYNADRAKNNKKYGTRQWEALRAAQLSKYPLCAGCEEEGRFTAANTVDHLFPWTHISEEAFYINHFQSLCSTHHATKTQLERHGIYRRFGTLRIDYRLADYSRVTGGTLPDAESRQKLKKSHS